MHRSRVAAKGHRSIVFAVEGLRRAFHATSNRESGIKKGGEFYFVPFFVGHYGFAKQTFLQEIG
jgi:hypothetical protein